MTLDNPPSVEANDEETESGTSETSKEDLAARGKGEKEKKKKRKKKGSVYHLCLTCRKPVEIMI